MPAVDALAGHPKPSGDLGLGDASGNSSAARSRRTSSSWWSTRLVDVVAWSLPHMPNRSLHPPDPVSPRPETPQSSAGVLETTARSAS